MNWKRIWVSLLCLCFVVLLIDDVFSQERQRRSRSGGRWPWKGPEIGSVIKDFELPTADGKKFKLSDHKGEIVVIELGACT